MTIGGCSVGAVFDHKLIGEGSEVNVNDFSLYWVRYGEEGSIYLRDVCGYLEDVGGRYVASKLVLDELGIDTPAMEYDEENSRILMEDLGETKPVVYTDEVERAVNEFEVEEYIDAVLGKYVVGNRDVTGNILLDEEGDLYAVDFVGAGEMALEDCDDVYGHVVERVEANLQRAGAEVSLSREDVRERAEALAGRIDGSRLREKLRSHEYLEGFEDIDVFISNIGWLEGRGETVLE